MGQKKSASRVDFGKIKEVMDIPDLIEIQLQSYKDFLQTDVLPEDRRIIGLQEIFQEIFPIKSYDESRSLEFISYSLGAPKYDVLESQRRGVTYSAVLKVLLRLKEEDGSVKEESIYLGNLPLMTDQGTFIINGAERVIVSQLHRSPGICFEKNLHPTKRAFLYSFRTIPNRGSWLEVQFDINDLLYIYVDRKKRRRKVLATTFMRAIGYVTDEMILEQFIDLGKLKLNSKKEINKEAVFGATVFDDKGNSVVKAGMKITKAAIEKLKALGLKEIAIIEDVESVAALLKMLRKDSSTNQEEALKDIYRKLRPGDPPTLANAKALIKRLFFDKRRYDLGRVGRYKLNQKLTIEEEGLEDVTVLRKEDIVEAISYLLDLKNGKSGMIDDIDHLGNRRVRSVGELLQNQCRVGLARIERLVKERMNFYDVETENITPHKLINPKGFSTVIKDFFGRSQLSQFMDQTNLLAEMTHKRRLSALGPGGLNRERAGFEVRDVHTSHYGRVCPIETPEGPNIGLISSLSTFAKINEFGFIITPYRKVVGKRVLNEIEYLTADQEERYIIAQSNIELSDDGKIIKEKVYARKQGEFVQIEAEAIQYIDISPKQLVSVAAGLIPFLEHDDANRALMGSNMQRQAVPLLNTEAPLVATGIEGKAAVDSRVMVCSDVDGVVKSSSEDTIIVTEKSTGRDRVFKLKKFLRSNSGTSVNQVPIALRGQKIKKGDVLADGSATDNGELALGRNVMVAFMPWNGYNFEDAIIISERLLKDDYYTSVHIEEFEVGCRDTKLGKEEITRDIPNVGEEALRNLGEDGIVRIGAEVKSGDILVGKITPKSETELSPEERLLRAIFGEKAADVRDASLTVPPGTEGTVMDVKVFSRKDVNRTEAEKVLDRKEVKAINADYADRQLALEEDKFARVKELLNGKTFSSDLFDAKTGEVIVEASKKIGKKEIEKIKNFVYGDFILDKCKLGKKFKTILMDYERELDIIETQHARDLELAKRGDELEPGLIKQVKVYIAIKRRLSVGDKMAGRHGNKGVIARILPEEDMPYMPDGTPVDIILNPLGVPSRMNVGQVLETFGGWAAKELGVKIQTPVFDGMHLDDIKDMAKKAGVPESGKVQLYDGRTGDPFDQKVSCGYIYMLKLSHIAADKIHARAIGPYSLVTQQPLGGKAQFGGQRFGEMEVWALEAYGAAYILQELLTVKSDDVVGRARVYESIVKNTNNLDAGTPESFNVLIKEMQSLGLDVKVEKN